MEIVRSLAGYSYGRSDLVRRAMAKKKKDVMEKERRVFLLGDEQMGVEGAVKRGVPAQVGEKLFNQMMDFAEYAFNKSHACAYAAVAYYTAYFKCHYKVEYLTALLNSFIGRADKISAYIQYCASVGIRVLPPDINKSEFLFSVEGGDAIRFGFAAIRDVGRAAEEIVTERKTDGEYRSFRGFIDRTVASVNKKMLEGLILAGCFDSLGLKRAQLMAVNERVLKAAQEASRRNVSGQISLFDAHEDFSGGDMDRYPDMAEYSAEKLLSQEKVATGVYLSGHPLDRYKAALEHREVNIYKILSAADDVASAKYFESRLVDLVGVLSAVRRRSTKAKQLMANALLEDLYGMIEIVIFPSVYAKCESLLVDDTIVRVSGRVDVREGEVPQLLVESVTAFNQEDAQFEGKKLYVRIPADADKERLRHILSSSSGIEPVAVAVDATGERFRTNGSLRVTLTAALVSSLTEAFGGENIVVQ